jgi:hypothetical protein
MNYSNGPGNPAALSMRLWTRIFRVRLVSNENVARHSVSLKAVALHGPVSFLWK